MLSQKDLIFDLTFPLYMGKERRLESVKSKRSILNPHILNLFFVLLKNWLLLNCREVACPTNHLYNNYCSNGGGQLCCQEKRKQNNNKITSYRLKIVLV